MLVKQNSIFCVIYIMLALLRFAQICWRNWNLENKFLVYLRINTTYYWSHSILVGYEPWAQCYKTFFSIIYKFL